MNIKSSKILVDEALKQVKTIEPEIAKKLQSDKSCNLIDIRDIRELERDGKIENAIHIPRGMLEFWLDLNSPYYKDGKIDQNKQMVLFCAAGMRSALGAKSLVDMGFKNVSHINGGFALMKEKGFNIL